MAGLVLSQVCPSILIRGAISVGLSRLLRGKEAFEDYVSEHAVHEAVVDIDQNA